MGDLSWNAGDYEQNLCRAGARRAVNHALVTASAARMRVARALRTTAAATQCRTMGSSTRQARSAPTAAASPTTRSLVVERRPCTEPLREALSSSMHLYATCGPSRFCMSPNDGAAYGRAAGAGWCLRRRDFRVGRTSPVGRGCRQAITRVQTNGIPAAPDLATPGYGVAWCRRRMRPCASKAPISPKCTVGSWHGAGSKRRSWPWPVGS